jgi:hypothetical protein
MANEFVAKNGLISQNNTTISGSLIVTQGITGSLQGTASYVSTLRATGSDTQIQYNNNGVLGAISNLTFNGGELAVNASIDQGLDNIIYGGGVAQGNSNYIGILGYNFSGATGGVITFEASSDISGEIGNYVAIDNNTYVKIYKVVSTIYDTGSLNPVILITLEDSTFSGNGIVGSTLTRQLTGGAQIVGPYNYQHAEGLSTIALSIGAHSDGSSTIAAGPSSYAGGNSTISNDYFQTVIGQFNKPVGGQSAFIIGNGTNDSNRNNLLYASGSQIQITGSLIVTQGITGSLQGTASWATNAVTASKVLVTNTTTGTGPYYVAFTQGTTGDQAILVDSNGLLFNATTNTLTVTSSFATTASFALTAGGGGISQGKVVAIATGYSNLF